MNYLRSKRKEDLLWVIGVTIVSLIATSILLTTRVSSYSASDIGLITKLPFTYWISLAILTVLLSRSLKSGRKSAIIVFLFYFHLFGLPILVRENMAEWLNISYIRILEATPIQIKGSLDFSEWWSLTNWPGYYFIAIFLSDISGVPMTFFAGIFPIFTMAFIGLISYLTLKLRFNSVNSSLGALWVVSAFWTGQHYYSPQALAYLIYFVIFFVITRFLISKGKTPEFVVCILLLFSGAVFTHLLTSFVIMIGTAIVYLFYRFMQQKILTWTIRLGLVGLTLLVFFSYQAIVIPKTFSHVATTLFGQLFSQDSHFSTLVNTSQSRAIGSLGYRLELFGTYGMVLIGVLIALVGLLTVLYGLFKKRNFKSEMFWAVWLVLAGIMAVSLNYGGEAIERAFMFMLLPVGYFLVRLCNSRPKLLLVIVLITFFIHIPACYTRENHIYVASSELSGGSHLGFALPVNSSYFYEDLAPLDTPFAHQINFRNIQAFYTEPNATLINDTLSTTDYIISSGGQTNLYEYFFGKDLIQNYTSLHPLNDVLFDNGGFKIYYHPVTL